MKLKNWDHIIFQSNRWHILLITFLTIFLVSCNNSIRKVDLTIISEGNIFWNEHVKVSVHNEQLDSSNLIWYLNDKEVLCSSSDFSFNTGIEEKRYIVKVKYKDNKNCYESNNLYIYNTKHYELLKSCYDFIDKYHVETSISVSVKTKNDIFSFCNGYTSLQSKLSCTENNSFFYYSITKTFISALICNLIEKGFISFETKISDIFDKTMFNGETINVNSTIWQLLCHRSGIGEYTSNYKIFLNNPFVSEEWNPLRILDFVEISSLNENAYVYSTANYVILGMIAEKVTNKKLNVLLKEHFLDDLSLNTVKLSPQDTINYSLLAHPHVLPNTEFNTNNIQTTIDITSLFQVPVMELIGMSSWAGGGLVGTSRDGAVWIYELFSKEGTAVSNDVRQLILESTENSYKGCEELLSFGICGRRIFYDDVFFVGSYGRSVGSNNLAFYNYNKDVGFCILTSSNSDKNGNPDVYELLCRLYDKL